MKKLILGLVLCITVNLSAQGARNAPSPYQEDWQSPQSIIAALYTSISAGPSETRDWPRFRALFFQGAQFIMVLETTQGGRLTAVDVEQMIEQTESHYKAVGFYETETDKQVTQYNQMANVYSAFEVKKALTDDKSLMSGLNHFQLLFDGNRWWIISNTSIISDEAFDL